MAHVVVLTGDVTRVEVTLEPVEAGLLASLATQIVEFVAPASDVDPLVALVGLDPEAEAPQDPALLRLLPDAYTDDADAAARFRRFTERDLREAKRAAALVVLTAISEALPEDSSVEDDAVEGDDPEEAPVTLVFEGDTVPSWLGLLNDARLTIGARLDITEDNHAELASLPDDDPRAGMYAVYDWLSYVQDATVSGLLGEP